MVVHACSLSYSGCWGRRIARTWEAEAAVGWDHSTALQPGDRARLHLKKRKKKERNRFVSNHQNVERLNKPPPTTCSHQPSLDSLLKIFCLCLVELSMNGKAHMCIIYRETHTHTHTQIYVCFTSTHLQSCVCPVHDTQGKGGNPNSAFVSVSLKGSSKGSTLQRSQFA